MIALLSKRLRVHGLTVATALVGAPLLLACDDAQERRLFVARTVYDRYCGDCHGMSDGDGPTRVAGLTTTPPDLRDLSREFGSPLPRETLAAFIDGRSDVAAHGPRDMPVWGEELYDHMIEAPALEEMRAGTIDLILDYLESVQRD